MGSGLRRGRGQGAAAPGAHWYPDTASFWVVLGERPEKGTICRDPSSCALCASAVLLMRNCVWGVFLFFLHFIFKLLFIGESAIQLHCLT